MSQCAGREGLWQWGRVGLWCGPTRTPCARHKRRRRGLWAGEHFTFGGGGAWGGMFARRMPGALPLY